jgi:hypothetical protein
VEPPADRYHEILRDVAVTYLRAGLEAGRVAFGNAAGEIWPGLPRGAIAKPIVGLDTTPQSSTIGGRRSFSSRRSAATFIRDGFHCRYCGCEVVPRPFAVLLSALYPKELPYTVHYKLGYMHPAYWTRVAEADHLVPGSAGGPWTDPENHVTACVVCNTRKGRYTLGAIGWKLGPVRRTSWDGLISLYDQVWHKAGSPDPRYHRPWLATFADS